MTEVMTLEDYPKCRRGHPLTPANIYVRPRTGQKDCRECRRGHHRKNRPNAVGKRDQELIRSSQVEKWVDKAEAIVLREMGTGDITANLRDRISRAFDQMTDEKLANASPRELAIVVGVFIDKLQLLEGKPTTIISTVERKGLDAAAAMLLAEMQRRGIDPQTIDGTATEIP